MFVGMPSYAEGDGAYMSDLLSGKRPAVLFFSN